MFGKPVWFRPSEKRWAVKPSSWQGWLYFVAWAVVVLLPALALSSIDKGPEALIWCTLAGGALVWDMRQVRSDMGAASAGGEDDVLYIGDDEDNSQFCTKKLNLQLRD